MDSVERWEYARRVMSNPIPHHARGRHPDVKPEWIENILATPYHQEAALQPNRELYYGWVDEIEKWVKVVVEDDQLLTAYIDRRISRRFGRLS